uniref:Ribosomal protein L46 N-terminal domain-containing protein n=1 Tax=Coccolithus braarudii TaxID=221442 RepID=A0A7S0L4P3_9EUKA|mmetsp:Transcript_14612/g.31662  ORF Transcript_14612/g.31662 Transcript_14612/m.31662 type:complete len:244 (+) Transcript_14612:18-749(+)
MAPTLRVACPVVRLPPPRLSSRFGAAASRARLSSSCSPPITLAALVERIPVLTPPVPEWKREREELQRSKAELLSKVYPEKFTASEEGPDRKQARLKLEALVQREGGREGEGDRTSDQRSMDRQLARRLYLLLRVDGTWQLPQTRWPLESKAGVREGLMASLAKHCGEELQLHWMGNAPLAHHAPPDGPHTFFWRLQHYDGDVDLDPAVQEHGWLTKEEAAAKLDEGGAELRGLFLEMCGPFD